MGRTGGLRRFVAVALLASVVAASSRAAATTPSVDPGRERPSTVVVRVRDGGFDWADAGVGAAAMLATTLLGLGVVLALRPDGKKTENHEALS